MMPLARHYLPIGRDKDDLGLVGTGDKQLLVAGSTPHNLGTIDAGFNSHGVPSWSG